MPVWVCGHLLLPSDASFVFFPDEQLALQAMSGDHLKMDVIHL
ncbi:hypothetical protein [Brasilonema sp. UFV-L1]|nr:hypothetical protein [Brasilonema sp. UFV-L1]